MSYLIWALHQATLIAIALIILAVSLALYPFFIFLIIIRSIVEVLAKIFRPDLESVMSAIHAIFAMGYTKDKALENCVVIPLLEGHLSLEEIRSCVQKRVFDLDQGKDFKFRLLKRTWSFFCGWAFWKLDTEFKLENHVRDYDYKGKMTLPDPCTEKDVHAVLAELFQAPWNRKRSPWELLRVPNVHLNGQVCTGLVIRMDHALGDGYSIMDFVRTISQSEFSVPRMNLSKRKFSFWEKMALVVKIPYDVSVNIRPALFTRGIIQQRPLLANEEIVSVSSVVDVAVVKQVKDHFKVNYATVVYAVICGAIERAMKASGQPVPKNVMAGVVIPVSGHPGGICNHVTTAAAELPIRRTNRFERLVKIQQDLVTLSRSAAVLLYIRASKRAGFAPTIVGRLSPLGAGRIGKMVGLGVMITNFPVTTTPDYFEGHEFLDMTVGVPTILPCGIFVSIGGLNNKQRFNFNVRRSLFASDEICKSMGKYAIEELELLLAETT